MGNSIYRISPRKIYNSSSGNSSQFQFAANQITGWRNSQEDRYVCLPNFYEDLSLFAVYDGHGGEEVVQYLERFLHQFISRELELTKDVELALFLSFLNCDSSIRSISDAEFALIENELVKEFEVPDKAERRRVLFGSIDGAGTSGENQVRDELRAAIASTCIKELPSISYLTQAPVQESDESDDDYQPGDEDINFFTDEINSSNQSGDSSESYSPESIQDEIMDVLDKEENTEKHILSTFKEDTGCCTRADMTENISVIKTNENTGSTVKEVKGKKEEEECNEEQKDFGKQIGVHCGSTATVLLISQTKIFIAHVGDSRCVACIKGQAVDLTTDHRPNDKEEYERIIYAGGSVSEDGRIEGDIDMSRAFGDFRYKAVDDPFQILSVEPSISSFEISPDLEFIIVASDGIWNTMDSADVVHYIQKRISDPNLELRDLCGELFEELMPEKITTDGSGCDNMTAVIIKFTSTQGLSKNDVCYREIYEYRYPPINNKSDNSSNNNMSRKSSTAENSKDCKESSQLKLDEKKLNNEKYIKLRRNLLMRSKYYEEKIHSEFDVGKEYCKSGFGEKKANYEIEDEKEFDKSSSDGRYSSESTKEYLNYVEKIPTHQKQQLYRSNEYCHPATIKTVQTDQQKRNATESCKKNSPQLPRNSIYNSLKNCHPKSRPNDQSIPLQHANNMDKILKSLNCVESAIQCLNANVSSIKTEVKNEIMRINNQYLLSYPTSSTTTTTQSPMQMKIGLVDPTNKDMLTTEQFVEQDKVVSQVDCAALQSPSIRMETDLVSAINKRVQNPEQSVEKEEDSECVVIQSNIKQIEMVEIDLTSEDSDIDELSFFIKHPVSKDKVDSKSVDSAAIQSPAMQIKTGPVNSTNEEIKPPASQSVDSAIMQSPTMQIETDHVDRSNEKVKTPELQSVDSVVMQSPTMQIETNSVPVDHTNEESKNPEQSVEQGKVVESTVMESPSMHNVSNLINPTNEKKQTTVQSADKKEEEIVRDSCKKKTPAEERKEFGR